MVLPRHPLFEAADCFDEFRSNARCKALGPHDVFWLRNRHRQPQLAKH